MIIEAIYMAREARNLSAKERQLIMTIASRGENGCYVSRQTLLEDLDWSRNTLDTIRQGLISKGILVMQKRGVTQTSILTININGLSAYTGVTYPKPTEATKTADNSSYMQDLAIAEAILAKKAS